MISLGPLLWLVDPSLCNFFLFSSPSPLIVVCCFPRRAVGKDGFTARQLLDSWFCGRCGQLAQGASSPSWVAHAC